MKIEISHNEAKTRILKMVQEHCWDIIKDLLGHINESSEKKNSESVKDIELTLDTIKQVQQFKDRVEVGIRETTTLKQILELCKDEVVIENEDDVLSAFFGYEIKIN